ncbi:uncharacterized protein KY384_007520 [Bacidia gigantensis]|uniref:uncharacterized protein n=1 Tax=Bacidia gigantensis TaxID=2732470 RepID=UPI001D046A14|nr:uncharacterized protein KY384_007520 [Bacidia gigantensis]KAG8527368.1 hypothetical protein KY384_007520 [Bacidia gigantensis]
MALTFLTLPPEIRLIVYRNLLANKNVRLKPHMRLPIQKIELSISGEDTETDTETLYLGGKKIEYDA